MEEIQGLIFILVVILIVSIIVIIVKTPVQKRWSNPLEKEEGFEYAPMYTMQEKIKIICIHLAWLIPFVVFMEFWFFPKLKIFSENANCYNFGDVNGVTVLFYSYFVGLPILMAIIVYAIQGSKSIRAFRAAQYPAPDIKVFKLTKYKYGLRARSLALIPLIGILLLLCLSIWGADQAQEWTKNIKDCQIDQPV